MTPKPDNRTEQQSFPLVPLVSAAERDMLIVLMLAVSTKPLSAAEMATRLEVSTDTLYRSLRSAQYRRWVEAAESDTNNSAAGGRRPYKGWLYTVTALGRAEAVDTAREIVGPVVDFARQLGVWPYA